MELIGAVLSRRSIRAYKPDPVPKEILKELLEIAIHAPSAEDAQPWEFAVVGGKVLTELKEVLLQKRLAGESSRREFGDLNYTDKYRERSRANGRRLFEAMGIAREDMERREQWRRYGLKLFDAPNAIIVYTDKALGSGVFLDIGLVMQTIMLVAQNFGLGTCAQYQMVAYPDAVRRILNIPESKLILCGIAIGYPNMEAPQNQFRSLREPLETLVTWHGFDDNLGG